MTDEELRALVRDAIARHLGSAPEAEPVRATPPGWLHASHAVFVLAAGADTDGACLIEPAVNCNHCGYCKSYGH